MTKAKNKGGRPTKPIDYKRLDSMCAIQCTGEECAAILDMSYDHLDLQLKADGNGGFKEYYKQKSANGKMSLRRRQYKAAVEDGNPTMLIWLGKQWLGQQEKATTGDEEQAAPVNVTFNVTPAVGDVRITNNADD